MISRSAAPGWGVPSPRSRLLYVTVDGDGPVPVASPSRLEEASADAKRLAAASSVISGEQGFGALGTAALYDLLHTRRMMPTDNFRRTFFAAAPGLNADAVRRRFAPGSGRVRGLRYPLREALLVGGVPARGRGPLPPHGSRRKR